MRSFTYSEHVDRPPDEIFAFMTDFAAAPRWRSLVRKVELASPGPIGAGSKLVITMDVMGRIRQTVSEVWAYDPPRRDGVRNTESNVTGVFEYILEPEDGGTRVRFTCDIQPHRLMWLAMPWLLKGNRSRYRDQLQRLKHAAEGLI
jgi:carbon monoxide dehydrogenase subunit G